MVQVPEAQIQGSGAEIQGSGSSGAQIAAEIQGSAAAQIHKYKVQVE